MIDPRRHRRRLGRTNKAVEELINYTELQSGSCVGTDWRELRRERKTLNEGWRRELPRTAVPISFCRELSSVGSWICTHPELMVLLLSFRFKNSIKAPPPLLIPFLLLLLEIAAVSQNSFCHSPSIASHHHLWVTDWLNSIQSARTFCGIGLNGIWECQHKVDQNKKGWDDMDFYELFS